MLIAYIVWATLGFIALVVYLLHTQPWIRRPFVNDSHLSDGDLWSAWHQAQNELASKPFPLAPFYRDAKDQDTRPADPRALKVNPRAIYVTTHVDEQPVSQGGGWYYKADGFYVNGLTSVAPWWRPHVWIAEHCERDVAVYEFQNVILHALGYNTRSR